METVKSRLYINEEQSNALPKLQESSANCDVRIKKKSTVYSITFYNYNALLMKSNAFRFNSSKTLNSYKKYDTR